MNAFTVLSVFIFCSLSQADSFLDFSELDKAKYQNEFFKNEAVQSSGLEDSSELRKGKSYFIDLPYFKDSSEDQRRKGDFPDVLPLSDTIIFTPKELLQMKDVSTEKQTHDYFPFYPNKHNFENTHIIGEKPQRRQIKEWKVSDDLLDSNNVPWVGDANYPKSGQNEHMIDSTYPENREEEGVSLVVAEDNADPREIPKQSQYYQKNYYYNYYPLMNQKKTMKWPGDEKYNLEESKKNFDLLLGRRKSPCRHYLDFLKYAFDKLDEDYEYNYSPNDDYEDWMIKDPGTMKPAVVLGTKVLGPTFFVDNSGKISQVNTNGNSVQVAEGVSPDSKIAIFSKTISKPSASSSTTTTIPVVQTTVKYNFDNTEEHSTESPTTTERRNTVKVTPEVNVKSSTEEDYDYKDTGTTPFKLQGRMRNTLGKIIPQNKEKASNINPSWFSRNSSTTPPSVGNMIKSKTSVIFNNSTDDADCNDKMLPCPDTVNITYPLRGYCNRYVTCESGRAIRRTCPDGLHFNVIIKSCDLPHNSICTYTCPSANGLFGIPGDCGGYFSCKNSNPEYRMCPPKMHWDINSNTCTFSELSSCPMKCTKDSDIKEYDGDCKGYVICLNGIPYYHKCPPNTKFSKRELTCIPSTMSECEDDPRLMTETTNPSSLCKDVHLQMNVKPWCRSFLNLKD